MDRVLDKLNFNSVIDNFTSLKISPDILCLLPSHELRQLGVTNRQEMVAFRNECIRFGIDNPSKVSSFGGPPAFKIPKHLILNLIDESFIISDIAKFLSVSERTLYRRMQEYNMSKLKFSECTDNECDICDKNLILEFPFCCASFLEQILKQRGVYVQRYRENLEV